MWKYYLFITTSPLWLDNHWSYMTKKHCLFFRDFKETMVTANPWYQKHKNVTPVHQWNISMVELEIGTYLRDIVQWFSGQAPSTTSSCSNGWGEVIVKIYIALDLSLPKMEMLLCRIFSQNTGTKCCEYVQRSGEWKRLIFYLQQDRKVAFSILIWYLLIIHTLNPVWH